MTLSFRHLLLVVPSLLCIDPVSAHRMALERDVATALEQSDATSMAAVSLSCEGEAVYAVSGVAREGSAQPLGADARFNLGSNAKSMLATLAATYVEDGRFSWSTSVTEQLSRVVPTIDPAIGAATLEQLLSHRSGLPSFDSADALDGVSVGDGSAEEQRLSFASQVLSLPPAYVPGSLFEYSNAGYVVAGVMLETLSEADFESEMRDRVFLPLGMDAQFGDPAGEDGKQPFGHFERDGRTSIHDSDEPAIPAFLQPAGDVSLSMPEYALYLREHLCGLQRKHTRLLKASTILAMHEPQGSDGASMGWGRFEIDGAPASIHVGGTGTFSAFVAVVPSRDLAVATVTNSGSKLAHNAAMQLLLKLTAPPTPATAR